MTPAEFDTHRRSLGLSVDEVAALCGVNPRTVNRWVTGSNPIPADAFDRLDALEDAMQATVDRLVAGAFHLPKPIVLMRHRTPEDHAASPHASGMPLGAHAILVGWAADALRDAGHDVRIEWASAFPDP